MSVQHWILVGQTPMPCTQHEWAQWFGGGHQVIKKTKAGKHNISTIFLGVDYDWLGTSPLPVLFETMVFCEHDGVCAWDAHTERTFAYPLAIKNHRNMARRLRRDL